MTALAASHGFENSAFVSESYDAAALIMLAMQAANSTDSNDWKKKVIELANEPGEKIYPGELAKALRIISRGGDINYEGASAVELVGGGESAGSYEEIVIEGGAKTIARYR